jgi:metal-responsive CopG/Arc/MetJ family transcriptional regulator
LSDAKHTGEDKIQFNLEKNLTEQFDHALQKLGYKNRADWFREKVRETIREASQR